MGVMGKIQLVGGETGKTRGYQLCLAQILGILNNYISLEFLF